MEGQDSFVVRKPCQLMGVSYMGGETITSRELAGAKAANLRALIRTDFLVASTKGTVAKYYTTQQMLLGSHEYNCGDEVTNLDEIKQINFNALLNSNLIKKVDSTEDLAKTKLCKSCEQDLPTTSFYKEKRCKDGLRAVCIDCYKKKNAADKDNNLDDYEG